MTEEFHSSKIHVYFDRVCQSVRICLNYFLTYKKNKLLVKRRFLSALVVHLSYIFGRSYILYQYKTRQCNVSILLASAMKHSDAKRKLDTPCVPTD